MQNQSQTTVDNTKPQANQRGASNQRLTKAGILLLVILFVILLITRCGSSGLVGEWRLSDVEGVSQTERDLFLAFTGTGTYTFTGSEVSISVLSLLSSGYETETYDYEVRGNQLVLLSNGNVSDSFEFSLSGNTLRMTKDGITMVLTKQ